MAVNDGVSAGSLEEALGILRDFELRTHSRFCVYTSSKDFGHTNIQSARKVFWEDNPSVKRGRLTTNGIPFVFLGSKRLDCQFGPDRKAKAKRYMAKSQTEDDHQRYAKGNKFLMCTTKKMDCPATVIFREICLFPTYQLEDMSQANTFEEDLMYRIQSGDEVPYQRKIIVSLPNEEDHTGHNVTCFKDMGIPEPIDKSLSKKINSLVTNGITDASLIRQELCEFVKETINPLPEPNNLRFYPSTNIIRNIVKKAKQYPIRDDMIKLNDMVLSFQEKSSDFLFCRLKSDHTEIVNKTLQYGSKFLLVYQSSQQKRLLERYGSTVIMDATYKTSLYLLPLFFLAVKTNVDYQVVACFITEDETISSIQEALEILKENSLIKTPPFFLTDFDESEIAALERVFKDSTVLLCNFHIAQAWERWCRKSNNVLGHKEDILKMLQKSAFAKDMDSFMSAVQAIRTSPCWETNSKFRHYFDKIWYPHHQRWSKAFRHSMDIVAGTTNGVEIQFRILKSSFLNKKTNTSLFNLVKTLVEDFFPARYRSYVESNLKYSGEFRKFSTKIPEKLQRRPVKFVKSCMQAIDGSKDIEKSDVKSCGNNSYHVTTAYKTFHVDLGDADRFPSCQCYEWLNNHMPCMHMCGVMRSESDVEWNLLSPLYMQSVYCITDDFVSGETGNFSGADVEGVDSNTAAQMNAEETECTAEGKENAPEDETNVSQVSARDAVKHLLQLTYKVTDNNWLKNVQETAFTLSKLVPYPDQSSATKLLFPRKRRAQNRHQKRCGVKANQYRKHTKLDIAEIAKSSADGTISTVSDCLPNVGLNDQTCLPEGLLTEDHNELCQYVQRIWEELESIEDKVVGPYIINTESIRCVRSFLSDEVIDAFLHSLIGCYSSKRIYHINCITMTAIFESQPDIHNCLRKVPLLLEYDMIIGAYNQARCHWCLIIILPKARKIIFLNPLGSLNIQEQDIGLSWFKFLKKRNDEGIINEAPNEWHVEVPAHAKQLDGSSCGVYVLKFADNVLAGRSLDFKWTNEQVNYARMSVAAFLLGVSKPRTTMVREETSVIGQTKSERKRSSFFYPTIEKKTREVRLYCLCQQPDDGRLMILCNLCTEWFHLHCLGMKETDIPKKGTNYFCKRCLEFDMSPSFKDAIADDEDGGIDESGFFVNSEMFMRHLPLVISRLFSIVSAESRSVHPWMTKHRHFPKGPYVYGYGYTVFSPQANHLLSFFFKQLLPNSIVQISQQC